MPWKIVERICKLEGSYNVGGRQVTIRPELFICLMTGRLQRLTGMELKDDVVGSALGMNKEEWKSKLDGHRENGYNVREALISMYAEKISQYYEKPPIILEVPSTDGAIVYTVFLCTDHDAGHYVMKIHKLPEYQEWRKINWKGDAETISKRKKLIRDAAECGQEQTFWESF